MPSQIQHVFLQLDDDHVQLLYLVDILIHDFFFRFLLVLQLIQLGPSAVFFVDLHLQDVPVLEQRPFLLLALVFQDFELILQDLNSLLQLR